MSPISGALDMRALRQLTGRDLYRPFYRDAMRSAVLELTAQGLKPRDIAQSLSLSESAVVQLLATDTAATTPEIP